MKKQNLLTTVLLLCALVAGSVNSWAQTYKYVKVSSINTTDQYIFVDETKKLAMGTDYKGTDVTIDEGVIEATGLTSVVFGNGATGYYTIKFDITGGNFIGWNSGNNCKNYATYTADNCDWEISFSGSVPTLANKKDSSRKMQSNKGSGDSNNKFAPYTSAQHSIAIYKKESAIATFSAGKTMISFSSKDNALDFTDANRPAGLKAYKVSAANATSVTLTEVTEAVAKNTGLILTGTVSTDYNIPVVASGTDISASNLLVATDGTSTVSDAAVLSNGEFHPLTSGVIAAGKAYLPYANIEGGNPFTGGAHALDIVFDNGDVTGIEQVANSQDSWLNGQFYDLQGRKVAQPTKGLYIVNGKKVVIK